MSRLKHNETDRATKMINSIDKMLGHVSSLTRSIEVTYTEVKPNNKKQ